MTKLVRIENADNADYKVAVEVWDVGQNGAPDVLAFTERLDYPTAMSSSSVYLTSTRYIKVREVAEDEDKPAFLDKPTGGKIW